MTLPTYPQYTLMGYIIITVFHHLFVVSVTGQPVPSLPHLKDCGEKL